MLRLEVVGQHVIFRNAMIPIGTTTRGSGILPEDFCNSRSTRDTFVMQILQQQHQQQQQQQQQQSQPTLRSQASRGTTTTGGGGCASGAAGSSSGVCSGGPAVDDLLECSQDSAGRVCM